METTFEIQIRKSFAQKTWKTVKLANDLTTARFEAKTIAHGGKTCRIVNAGTSIVRETW